ncbi:DUF1758 domain-containing protein [Trichonephila clavipes]|nr:DUF1758 domain-containing protein [Trichonephila clavipes]
MSEDQVNAIKTPAACMKTVSKDKKLCEHNKNISFLNEDSVSRQGKVVCQHPKQKWFPRQGKFKKDELRSIADELKKLVVPDNAKVLDLRELIQESEIYKNDKETYQAIVDCVLEEINDRRNEDENRRNENENRLEIEKIKLSQLEKELEIAKLHNQSGKSLPLQNENQLITTECNIESKIDVLLGAEIFYELLRPGQIYCGDSRLLLQNTVFGYVVSGSVGDEVRDNNIHCGLIRDGDLNTTTFVKNLLLSPIKGNVIDEVKIYTKYSK